MWAVSSLLFTSFWQIAKTSDVSCVYKQSCILPCSFQSYGEDVIHWFKVTSSELQVHTFYNNQDQLGRQDQNFTGRTSLFKDQISRGNASLLLKDVTFEDQGTYSCSTSSIGGREDLAIRLTVEVPVSKVSISQEENRIICSSERIYPQPELTWSIIPPSNITQENRTTVHQSEDQLYNISSSLMVSDGDPDLIYSCTVRTRGSKKKSTFRQLPKVTVTTAETTIPCLPLKTSAKNLVWRFNHQIILNTTGTDVTVSERWRKHVREVSEDGNLTLQDLSAHLEGSYCCEVRDEDEAMVTLIILKIQDNSSIVVPLVIWIVVIVIIVISLLLFVCWKKKRSK